MYNQQIKTLRNKEDFYAFNAYFRFEPNDLDAEIDFVNSEWFKFSDHAHPHRRKAQFKNSYEVFENERHYLVEWYNNWLYKYSHLYHYWLQLKEAQHFLPEYEKLLTKPLYKYATNRHGEYANYNAEKVRMYTNKEREAKNEIERLLKISDQVPEVHESVLTSYNNLLYFADQIEADLAKKSANKRIKKEKQVVNAYVPVKDDGYSLQLLVNDFRKAIKGLSASDYVLMATGTFQVKTLKDWLSVLKDETLKLTLTDEGMKLETISTMGSSFKVTANFKSSNVNTDNTIEFVWD